MQKLEEADALLEEVSTRINGEIWQLKFRRAHELVKQAISDMDAPEESESIPTLSEEGEELEG